MFPANYFSSSYFPDNYWPKVGADAPAVSIVPGIECRLPGQRPHFRVEGTRPDYPVEGTRPHYRVGET